MIISISGLIASGKDTAADYLCTVYGFKRMSWAGSLKDAVSNVFGWDRELLEGSTKESRIWREQVDTWWANRLNIPDLTPRWILQQWGTEVCRKSFHDEIWVASVENQLRNIKSDVVLTDSRFPNEIAAIRKAGGITVRTHRGQNPEWYIYAEMLNTVTSEAQLQLAKIQLAHHNIHASEYSSVGLEYDYHIDNNKSIDYLHRQLDEILKSQS